MAGVRRVDLGLPVAAGDLEVGGELGHAALEQRHVVLECEHPTDALQVEALVLGQALDLLQPTDVCGGVAPTASR